MSRKKASERGGENAGPIVTQEKPTAQRPRDAQGYELDQWGLPFSGPARLRALAGRPDPNVAPEAWESGSAPEVRDAVTHVPTDTKIPPVIEPETEHG